jgi:hypothetical protein
MNKYNNGKIYKIIDNTNGNIYIGSSIQTLKERLRTHINSNCASKEIIKNGNYRIELIEDYPCNNKEELRIREQYYIDNLECINLLNSYTSKEYRKEYKKKYDKEYHIKNKVNILNRQKEYYNNNKNQKKEYYNFKNSWGGDKRSNNNLLEIDINILI